MPVVVLTHAGAKKKQKKVVSPAASLESDEMKCSDLEDSSCNTSSCEGEDQEDEVQVVQGHEKAKGKKHAHVAGTPWSRRAHASQPTL